MAPVRFHYICAAFLSLSICALSLPVFLGWIGVHSGTSIA